MNDGLEGHVNGEAQGGGSLSERIKRLIRANGPMGVAEYMQFCLYEPEFGYYTSGNPIGIAGDFITAPEVSQLFGEMIALWVGANLPGIQAALLTHGHKNPVQLVELGPGRGTLMADMLRTLSQLPPGLQPEEIVLVEISASLRQHQARALQPFNHRYKISWIEDLTGLAPNPTLFVGNEFFDAIVFRQFQKFNGTWLERCVGLDAKDRLVFVPGKRGTDKGWLPEDADQVCDGTVFEVAPAREALAAQLARHVAQHGGGGLIIDYGGDQQCYGDSFQALWQHQKCDVFEHIGHCDLTSHVDFRALQSAIEGEGCNSECLMTQGDFLSAMGIFQRAEQLARGKDGQVVEKIQHDVERLVDTEQMGELFKVMGFAKSGVSLVPFGDTSPVAG